MVTATTKTGRQREPKHFDAAYAKVRYALTRGWLIVEDGHRVCLTDAGRLLNIATRIEN